MPELTRLVCIYFILHDMICIDQLESEREREREREEWRYSNGTCAPNSCFDGSTPLRQKDGPKEPKMTMSRGLTPGCIET